MKEPKDASCKQFSRRRFVGLSASTVSLLAASSLARSSAWPQLADPMTAADAATAPIKRGGTLVHAYTNSPDMMDPHLSGALDWSGYEALYDGLVGLQLVNPTTGEHKIVGVLAESWDQRDAKTV